MSDVISLNKARKKKTRADKDVQATQNRAKFGRTKIEKERCDAAGVDLARHIDGCKRDAANED